MTTNIILTTGLYDLIKDHLRRKRVTKDQEDILTNELRHAEQILRRDLSEDIVSVGKKVTIKELTSNEEYQLNFVSPEKAKPKKNRHSILMDEGLATIGYKKGDVVEWPTEKGTKKYEILNVETVA
ncbi:MULTISPECIES: GreA/GreB family elongation factor [Empedobacter]|uniref:GreA/GreB family elongation factor n=1 Tax=Empedobacter tilapiae TaxID=2491114 RepID=A0A4Z1AZQ9_9FLAO|nr:MULTISPECIES: GreA/GreB family elongation factor [Empedobacter]MDH0674447.1 GreA/GreB family elongation factor [Empedobacter sp. GD03861]MDH1601933.1 GreA/GreB family elongation factor [Empedobacter sp. GD03739]TGN26123.1 GreA/GreB family elongation factor [Empedobacter tilapiae]